MEGAPKLTGAAPLAPVPDVPEAGGGAAVFGAPKENGAGEDLLSLALGAGGPKEKGELAGAP